MRGFIEGGKVGAEIFAEDIAAHGYRCPGATKLFAGVANLIAHISACYVTSAACEDVLLRVCRFRLGPLPCVQQDMRTNGRAIFCSQKRGS